MEQTRPSDLRVLIKEPYVRLLFIMVTLYTISIVMVENLSFAQAEIRFPTADGMATYVGLFMGIYGVLGLLVQWLIAGRILDRFGVTATMLAYAGRVVYVYVLLCPGREFQRGGGDAVLAGVRREYVCVHT